MIVFLNSRNGQQSVELKKKFCRYLGPNQVFELTQGGPAPGLELFKNVPNLRVLACGYVTAHVILPVLILCNRGDGTVAWVLEYVSKAGV